MAEKRQVNLAIIGAGRITELAHLPAALRLPDVSLYALVDANPENARRLARKYAVNCVVDRNLEDIIPKVDGVIIATPHATHFAVASQVLKSGLPILVEKPMTTTYLDAMALCELAEKHKIYITVGYQTRCFPSVVLLKQLLDNRALGSLISFHYEYGTRGGWAPVSGYNIIRSASGGGVLISVATHFIDRMLYWFGEPKAFTYWDDSYGGVEANCKAEFLFDNGSHQLKGTLFVSKTVDLKNRFVLETDKYVCILGESQATSITVYPKDSQDLAMEWFPRDRERDFGLRDPYTRQLEAFVETIRSNGKPLVDGRTAARSVGLIEKMYRDREQLEEPWLRYQRVSK